MLAIILLIFKRIVLYADFCNIVQYLCTLVSYSAAVAVREP